MNERAIASIIFFELMVLILTLTSVAELGFVDLSRTLERAEERGDRWELLLQRIGEVRTTPNPELERLCRSIQRANGHNFDVPLAVSELSELEQYSLGVFADWAYSDSALNVGMDDGFALYSVVSFAVHIAPPIELPVNKLLSISNAILQRGHAVDAIVSLNTVELLLKHARLTGLTHSDLSNLRTPTTIDLTKALMRAPIDVIETYKRMHIANSFQLAEPQDDSETAALVETWKHVAVDLGEQYWERRHDLELLRDMPIDDTPYPFVMEIADLLELQTPHITLARSRLASRTASTVEQWSNALNRREALLLGIPVNESSTPFSD